MQLDQRALQEQRAQELLARLALQELAPRGQRETQDRSDLLAQLATLVQSVLGVASVGSVLRALRARPATLAQLVTLVRQDPVVQLELRARPELDRPA